MTCHDLSPTKEAFKKLLEHLGDLELIKAWEKLRSLMKSCKLHNEVNGRLLNIRRHSNETILKLLLGNRHMGGETYSAAGRTGSYTRTGLSAVV